MALLGLTNPAPMRAPAALLLALVALLVVPAQAGADDGAKRRPAAKATAGQPKAKVGKSAKAKPAARGGKKVAAARGKATRKKKARRPRFVGHNAPASTLRTEPLAKPSGEIWLWAENLNEEVKVQIYREDGSLNDEVLAQLDDVFRCKRTHDVRAVRPELYEMLSRIYDQFGQQRLILVSGYRATERAGSRHHHASAMDLRVPGVSIKEVYAYAQSLDTGGMGIGIYPNSGFVHVDFRAPASPSYRWTDYSPPGGGKVTKKGRRPASKSKKATKRRPNV